MFPGELHVFKAFSDVCLFWPTQMIDERRRACMPDARAHTVSQHYRGRTCARQIVRRDAHDEITPQQRSVQFITQEKVDDAARAPHAARARSAESMRHYHAKNAD